MVEEPAGLAVVPANPGGRDTSRDEREVIGVGDQRRVRLDS